MSFLRHARSIGPMGQVKTILRLKPCRASRCSAPGFAAGRDCNTAPSLIVRDEYAPAIPWRVALQQSLPPFHRMRPVCYESICRSRDFHRTASCVLTVCLGPGGHRKATSRHHGLVNAAPLIGCFPQRSQFGEQAANNSAHSPSKIYAGKETKGNQNEYLASPTPFRHQSSCPTNGGAPARRVHRN